MVKEIVDAGGEAIADTHSVAEESSAEAIVQTALDAWGKVDILINNAGIGLLAEFDEITSSDVEKIIHVHLFGSIWMSRAVWPHMKSAGYGRIVSAASTSMLGQRYNSIYGAAKAGIWSLMRSLAVEGAEHGIKANSFQPGARTGMAELCAKPEMVAHMPPSELVAPTVVYLAHEDCETSGGCFSAAAGATRFAFCAETEGIFNPDVTLEEVRDKWGKIMDTGNHTIVPEPLDNRMSEIIEPIAAYVPA